MTGRLVDGTAWSPTLGEDIRYRACVPAAYDRDDRRYPTAYLLHGRGGGQDDWMRVVPRLDELPPVILVMPDAPWSDRGSWYVDSSFTGIPTGRPVRTALTEDLVAHVDATHRTLADREHRVVGGCSMGGAGALELLFARPDLFSGALALSPAVYEPLPPADSTTRVFGAFGSGTERFVDAVYAEHTAAALLAARDPAHPVRLYLAAGDRHDLDRETSLVHDHAQRAAGVSSRLRVLSGGHDWAVWEEAFVDGLPYVLGVTVEACS